MLRIDDFALRVARTYPEALALYQAAAGNDPMYLAGGTDLLPNLKHRIVKPRGTTWAPGSTRWRVATRSASWPFGSA